LDDGAGLAIVTRAIQRPPFVVAETDDAFVAEGSCRRLDVAETGSRCG
jgi:hypothetical protein